MMGFEPWISGLVNDRPVNCAKVPVLVSFNNIRSI